MVQVDPPSVAFSTNTPSASSEGIDGGQPYKMRVEENCGKHTFSFAEIIDNHGIDVGVYYDEDGKKCAWMWEFEFNVGALLASVSPDLDARSFNIVRKEGDIVNIAALEFTTGWTIDSHKGWELWAWFGLPAVLAKAGDSIEVTFQDKDGDVKITLLFEINAEADEVTITQL